MNCLQCKKYFTTLQEDIKFKKVKSFNKEYLRALFDVKSAAEILSCLLSCGYIKSFDKTTYTINNV